MGNASGIDREAGLVAIKPSGVPYQEMGTEDIVVVDLAGRVVAGARRPSTDTPTHLALYRSCPEMGGIVHTHSTWATSWAQAELEIPVLGTTHADLCPGAVPLARWLSDDETGGAYEENTGLALLEAIGDAGIERCPPPSSPATVRSPGARTPRKRSSGRSPSRRWRAWPGSRSSCVPR